jgi:Asp-tRNA(Asn)/Glu-tRNA(Gln) amidotransferase A subunit family amidase
MASQLSSKDQIETKGIITTFGFTVAKYHVSDEDATLVKKLKNSGAVVIGKSIMPSEYNIHT